MRFPSPLNRRKPPQHFMQGRVHMGNIKTGQAAQALDKALQLDPDFAMAHMFRAQNSEPDRQSFMNHFNKAIALKENVSEGEQLMIYVMQANVENRPDDAVSNKGRTTGKETEHPQ